MMHDDVFVDGFDIIMAEDEEKIQAPTGVLSISDAFLHCLNTFGKVDMGYITAASGKDIDEVICKLRGAVYQDPDVFDDADYNKFDGWVVSDAYLCGNIVLKLEKALKADAKYGTFKNNIEALKKVLPPVVPITDIYISLGATWIPKEEYELFIFQFLGVRAYVSFFRELNVWNIDVKKAEKSTILNKITYGVRKGTSANGAHQYLTAVEIIEQTMNSKTIKVYDYVPKNQADTEAVLNIEKTIEAQEIQRKIINAFTNWIYTTERRMKRFENYYNNALHGYARSSYDGSFLSLPNLNPDITLYKHQKDAVARVLLSGTNVLLSHEVGTGKTYEMIVSVSELYRLGISKKNLVVVPNNVLGATVDMHRLLYPSDKLMAVYPKDFGPKNRAKVLKEIKDGDFTAVYMAYSSFDMIVMSFEYNLAKLEASLRQLNLSRFNAPTKQEKNALEARMRVVNKKIEKYKKEYVKSPWMNYDELGITTLVVDEAHNYKNIPLVTKTSGIVGMSGSCGSKKCREMLEKVHSTPRVVFSTGTPLTNSLADLYAFQTYLQPEVLRYHNISTFDMWINTFGKRETLVECDLDSNSGSLRTMTRFSSFHNLGELMALFSQVCDFHQSDEKDLGLPHFEGHTDICVPKNSIQKEYILSLSDRVEKIRAKEVKRKDDNLLKVTIDGRKAALDIRLTELGEYCDTDTPTKIEVCAQKIREVNLLCPDSVQIVFCDIGVPKDTFNVYDELRRILVQNGISGEDIAFVHDATSEKARANLFREMNRGTKKVVIGSTEKLGVGVNVQEKLVAIHHLSVPWRPADMVQREGRIIRKGNTCEEVYIFRYITEGSFDAYSWQLLENKQRFISSFLAGVSAEREIADIADAVLSYAEVKALAIGNPLIKKRVEVANEIERKKLSVRLREAQLRELRELVENLPSKIHSLDRFSAFAASDYASYVSSKGVIGLRERKAFGEELLESLSQNVMMSNERVFDTYQGFEIVLPAKMEGNHRYVVVKGKKGSYMCEFEGYKTALGCSRTIDSLLENLEKRSQRLQEAADKNREQLKRAKEDILRGNEYTKIVEELETELTEIDRILAREAQKAQERKGA